MQLIQALHVTRNCARRCRIAQTRQDLCGDLLGQHVDGTLWLSRDQEWHSTDINNSKVIDTKYSGVTVDDGHGVVGAAHFAGGRSVVQGGDDVLDPVEDLSVGLDGWARVGLAVDEQLPERCCVLELADVSEGSDSKLLISWVFQPVGADDWWAVHGSRVDGDVTTAECGQKTDECSSSGRREKLGLWPVGWVSVSKRLSG